MLLLKEPAMLPLLALLHEIMGYMDLYRSVEPHLQCTDHLFVNGRRALYATSPSGQDRLRDAQCYCLGIF